MERKPTRSSPQQTTPNRPRFNIFYFLFGIWMVILLSDLFRLNQNLRAIPYSEFIEHVEKGRVAEVSIGSERIVGQFKSPVATPPAATQAPGEAATSAPPPATQQKPGAKQGFSTIKIDDPDLTRRLETSQVKFTGIHESTFFRDLLSWVIPALVLAAVWLWVMSRFSQRAGGGGGFLALGKSKARIYVEKDLKTRFEDVAGVDEGKEELLEIVNFLKDPTRYTRLGGRMPKGVLLVGPPGTGKTLMARAVAGEAGVPFFSINGSEFVELFVGLGAARVRDLFQQARAHAPCILFIDELDALGKARGLNQLTGTSNDEKEQTLNQLLAELDGFDASTGIVLLGATNRPEVLDPALLRAGRFDRTVVMDKPDRAGRKKILEIHMKKVKIATAVDAEAISSLTAGFSGADLANLVNEAALIATRRGAEQVEMRDCTEAIERLIAGIERKSRVLTPNDKRRVAFHEMGHALVALAVGQGEAVHKVSIIPRGVGALGYTIRRPTEDRYLMSVSELESKLAVLMGGRAAEQLFFKEVSTGAADDLDKATEVARAMVTRYGMNSELGLTILERESAQFLSGGAMPGMKTFNYSEATAQKVDREVRELLDRSMETALDLLQRYRGTIEEGAQILLTKETIDEGELKSLWDRRISLRAV
jgi:cell division protease FtsH